MTSRSAGSAYPSDPRAARAVLERLAAHNDSLVAKNDELHTALEDVLAQAADLQRSKVESAQLIEALRRENVQMKRTNEELRLQLKNVALEVDAVSREHVQARKEVEKAQAERRAMQRAMEGNLQEYDGALHQNQQHDALVREKERLAQVAEQQNREMAFLQAAVDEVTGVVQDSAVAIQARNMHVQDIMTTSVQLSDRMTRSDMIIAHIEAVQAAILSRLGLDDSEDTYQAVDSSTGDGRGATMRGDGSDSGSGSDVDVGIESDATEIPSSVGGVHHELRLLRWENARLQRKLLLFAERLNVKQDGLLLESTVHSSGEEDSFASARDERGVDGGVESGTGAPGATLVDELVSQVESLKAENVRLEQLRKSANEMAHQLAEEKQEALLVVERLSLEARMAAAPSQPQSQLQPRPQPQSQSEPGPESQSPQSQPRQTQSHSQSLSERSNSPAPETLVSRPAPVDPVVSPAKYRFFEMTTAYVPGKASKVASSSTRRRRRRRRKT